MSTNPYSQSTEHLTARAAKITKAQALEMVRKPAIGLLAVSGLALGLASVTVFYYISQFAIEIFVPDETIVEFEEPDPKESLAVREAREKREKQLKAEGDFISAATVFLAFMMLVLLNSIVLAGALNMRKLRKHRSAVTAAGIAIIPIISPLLIVGIPFGVWAMVKLSDPEIKRYFTQ
jgi:hypothetical protein